MDGFKSVQASDQNALDSSAPQTVFREIDNFVDDLRRQSPRKQTILARDARVVGVSVSSFFDGLWRTPFDGLFVG